MEATLHALGASRPAPASPWLVKLNDASCPRAAVVCLAHAGGTAAAYRSWRALLPDQVQGYAVELPGHAARFDEPLLERVEQVVDGLMRLPDFGIPTVLFGHSLGATLAFEWARALEEASRPAPHHLFVSARCAPHAAPARGAISALPDRQFIAELGKYQGLPAELLEHEELLDFLLPVLRADFALAETYRYRPDRKLACPITMLGGAHDAMVDAQALAAWGDYTSAGSELRMFSGGHFYLHGQLAQVVQLVLDAACHRDAPASRHAP